MIPSAVFQDRLFGSETQDLMADEEGHAWYWYYRLENTS